MIYEISEDSYLLNEGTVVCSSILGVFIDNAIKHYEIHSEYLTPQSLYSLLEHHAQYNARVVPLLEEYHFLCRVFQQPTYVRYTNTRPALNSLYALKHYSDNLHSFMCSLQTVYTPILNDTNRDYISAKKISEILIKDAEILMYYDATIAETLRAFGEYCASDIGNFAISSDFIYNLDNCRELLGYSKLDTNIQLTAFNALVMGYLLYAQAEDKLDYYNFVTMRDLATLCHDVVTNSSTLDNVKLRASNLMQSLAVGMTIKGSEQVSELDSQTEIDNMRTYTNDDIKKALTKPFKDAIKEGVRIEVLNKYKYCFNILKDIENISRNYLKDTGIDYEAINSIRL